jgi:hypothetical protein
LIASFVVGLGLVLFWAIPAYIETNGNYWREGLSEGVGERMVTGLQGHGASTFGWYLLSLPFYLLLFWLSALPWSPLLVIHRRKLFAAWKLDVTDTYLLLNAGIIFVVFTLMVTKLPHYTLPAFPFLALVFARRWKSVALPKCGLIKLGWITGGVLALLSAVLIPIAIANHATPSPVGELVRDAEFPSMIEIEPATRPHAGTLPLGFSPAPLTEDTAFALVDFQEPSAIWEMRRVVKGYGKTIPEADVLIFLQEHRGRAVILSSDLWDRLIRSIDLTDAFSPVKVYRARGFNAAKGTFVDLTLVVKP